MDVQIDKDTAHLVGQMVAGVAVGAGLSPTYAPLAPLAVKLAVRLTDAGYQAPDVEALRAKRDQLVELEELPEGPEA